MAYTGSVRKEGSKWYYVIEMGRDANNKRIQKKKRGFKTKKEAKQALTEALNSLNSGTFVEPSKEKLGIFLDKWLEMKRMTIKESTFDTYRLNLTTHIIPELGNIPLKDLNPMIIQRFYLKLKNEKGLSNNTVRKLHSILVNALNHAVKLEMIVKNPVNLVDPPKEENSEMKVWDVEEVRQFLEVARGSHFYMVYLIALTTGMRQGEILGLSWNDINFDDGIIHVRQTLSKDGKKIIPSTKTASGTRSIAMPDELIAALKQHKISQSKHRLRLGPLYHDMNLVNSTENGTPINASNLRRNFSIFIKKANVKKIRFHDLRHTHATLLLKQGVHPKIVSERLGHADTRITLDRYSHLLPNMQKDTAREFGKMLFGQSSQLSDQNQLKESPLLYVTNW
jgi:integrase